MFINCAISPQDAIYDLPWGFGTNWVKVAYSGWGSLIGNRMAFALVYIKYY
jgi:hypothetical protein